MNRCQEKESDVDAKLGVMKDYITAVLFKIMTEKNDRSSISHRQCPYIRQRLFYKFVSSIEFHDLPKYENYEIPAEGHGAPCSCSLHVPCCYTVSFFWQV